MNCHDMAIRLCYYKPIQTLGILWKWDTMPVQIIRQTAIIILFFIVYFSSPDVVFAAPRQQVLVLNSYHFGMGWTDSQIAGVRSELAARGMNPELHVEYMDTKRLNDTMHFDNLRALFAHKYQNTHFDAIVATDNDAFNFLRLYRDGLFGHIPVIFSGVNYFQPAMLQGQDKYTGVAETLYISDTVALMLKLHTNTKRIVVVLDNTTTSQTVRAEVEATTRAYQSRVKFEFWDNLTLANLRTQLHQLNSRDLVLLMTYSRDEAGQYVDYAELAKLVSEASPVPVYSVWDFYFGYGIVGGVLTHGQAQGAAAGVLLARVLRHETVNAMPVVANVPASMDFDDRVLRRFSIHTPQLPAAARLFFQPWYLANLTLLLVATSALLVVISLVFWAVRNMIKRRDAEQAQLTQTQQSEERLRALLEAAPIAIRITDMINQHVLFANAQYAKCINVDLALIAGYPVADNYKNVQDYQRILDNLARGVAVSNELVELNILGLGQRWMLGTYQHLDYFGQPAMLAWFYDVTEIKQQEIALRIAATAFESQVGMMVTNAHGLILQVNRAFTRMTGYAADEVVGELPDMLRSGRQASAFYADMWQSIVATGVWKGEIWNRCKDLSIVPMYLNISAVKCTDGRISHYVATYSDMLMSQAAADEIKRLAFYDQLTALPNRAWMLAQIQQAQSLSHSAGHIGAILFMDIDNFKTINDTLGHAVGDLLLQQVAQRLCAYISDAGIVARLGGDEFAVLYSNLGTDKAQAMRQIGDIARDIISCLIRPYQLASYEVRCGVSIGLACFTDRLESVDDLVKRADIAMYQAKRDGHNQIRVFNPAMQLAINNKADLERDLSHALVAEQLRLYYQLQLDDDGVIIGAEALVRWQSPERGMVSPIVFIPLAEETGQIIAIGNWVLKTACMQLKLWAQDARKRSLCLAVNVSAKQLHQVNFVSEVAIMLLQTGANPRRLKLEITESVVLVDVADTLDKMRALKKLGVRFSMDDFGTGYSSLSNLKQLPIDQIKIDQSFVRDLTTDEDDAVIVATIISMAKQMGLVVIAEGVENEAQRDLLITLGCRYFQGYLFSQPLPIVEFEQLLGDGAWISVSED
jgi:diguanylate cyclase (GGDEF)-like protein/PAS domain S-box-containing protein